MVKDEKNKSKRLKRSVYKVTVPFIPLPYSPIFFLICGRGGEDLRFSRVKKKRKKEREKKKRAYPVCLFIWLSG